MTLLTQNNFPNLKTLTIFSKFNLTVDGIKILGQGKFDSLVNLSIIADNFNHNCLEAFLNSNLAEKIQNFSMSNENITNEAFQMLAETDKLKQIDNFRLGGDNLNDENLKILASTKFLTVLAFKAGEEGFKNLIGGDFSKLWSFTFNCDNKLSDEAAMMILDLNFGELTSCTLKGSFKEETINKFKLMRLMRLNTLNIF